MVEGLRNLNKEIETDRKSRIEIIEKTWVPGMDDATIRRVELFLDDFYNNPTKANIDSHEYSLTTEEKEIARELLAGEPNITVAFNDRKEDAYKVSMLERESKVHQILDNISTDLGKGQTKGKNISPELKSAFTDIGVFSVKEGALEGEGARSEVTRKVGEEIRNIFDHLDGYRWNGLDFAETINSDVQAIIDGKSEVGTKEWYKSMDAILELYLPKNREGRRIESQTARDRTQSNFSGESIQEENSYEILMEVLRAYGALRSIDILEKNDPLNPENFDID